MVHTLYHICPGIYHKRFAKVGSVSVVLKPNNLIIQLIACGGLPRYPHFVVAHVLFLLLLLSLLLFVDLTSNCAEYKNNNATHRFAAAAAWRVC
jgi:uncharacterized membrane protein